MYQEMSKAYAALRPNNHKNGWVALSGSNRQQKAKCFMEMYIHQVQLDESKARLQMKSPDHYLVDPYTWPWSPNGHGHGHEWPTATPLWAMSIGPPILRYSYFKFWPCKSVVKVMCVVKGQGHIWPSKFKGQNHGQGQTHSSHLRAGVQPICLLFVLWQPDHFWLRYRKSHIWPWKFKVKVMAKVKPDGHIWCLEFNRYGCSCFVAIGPFLAEI